MATNQKPEYSEEELKNAQLLWDRFIHYSKVGIAAIVVLVALMALFLV